MFPLSLSIYIYIYILGGGFGSGGLGGGLGGGRRASLHVRVISFTIMRVSFTIFASLHVVSCDISAMSSLLSFQQPTLQTITTRRRALSCACGHLVS